MNINGVTNLNQLAAMQMTKTQIQNQVKTAAAAKPAGSATANTQATKPSLGNDLAERLSRIPNLKQYETLIGRFLSGESEMESAGKPLTEDQIALRGFMREFGKSDTRTPSEIQEDMRKASSNFNDNWISSGNTGPRPGRLLAADGSFKTFNSKAEKDAFMKNQSIDFLKEVMSVISAGKNSGNTEHGNCLNITV